MKRTLPWLALAFTLLPACGGSSSSPAQPASGPASPTAPATPGAVAPGGGGATKVDGAPERLPIRPDSSPAVVCRASYRRPLREPQPASLGGT